MPATVIPYIYYKTPCGRTFSQFSSALPADAVRVEKGFTIQWPDGTTGIGRAPCATREEAQAIIDRMPNFPGLPLQRQGLSTLRTILVRRLRKSSRTSQLNAASWQPITRT